MLENAEMMHPPLDTKTRSGKSERNGRTRQKLFDDLSQLYAAYGKGNIPQRIRHLADRLEAKLVSGSHETEDPGLEDRGPDDRIRVDAKKQRARKVGE